MHEIIREWATYLKWRRFGVDIRSAWKSLNQSQYWPAAKLREYRDEKLRRIIAHAYEQIPYYRRMLDERGVRPEHIKGLADLSKLPVMTKPVFHEHWDDLRARDIPDSEVERLNTGGTTGNPMPSAREHKTLACQIVSHMRGVSWGGLALGRSSIMLTGWSLGGGRPPPRLAGLRNWLLGAFQLSAYDLAAPGIISRYAKAIRRSGAQFLVGYASACYLLATLAEQAGEHLRLTTVFPTSELCPPDWAETMARVFSAKVLPFYGCGEVNSLGHTCPQGGVYHTCDEHVVIEVEDVGGGSALEGEGAFLITDLDNRAVPFIRYRNGDAGKLAGPGCACGRSLGRIVQLHGRINDMLVASNGARVSGMVAANAFLPIRNVESFQVVQRLPGQLTVRVVREAGYEANSAESQLQTYFRRFLGEDALVEFEYVASIPSTSSGKRRFVINEYLATASSRP